MHDYAVFLLPHKTCCRFAEAWCGADLSWQASTAGEI